MITNQLEPWQQESIIQLSQRLLDSYHHWTGKILLNVDGSPQERAQQLFAAPFVLVAHDTQPEPVFNYGNQQALELWELSWEEFTNLPSHQSAEAESMIQEERDRLLAQVTTQGLIENYSGIRISSSGKRFRINNGIVWNLINQQAEYCGQAAVFSNYQFL